MEQHNIEPAKNQEIDLFELVGRLWKKRVFILKFCGIGALFGLIVAFSIPKEYVTEVKLSPEVSSDKNKLGNMGDLASMAGINLGGTVGSEALSPELYPDIVSSVPFLLELVDVQVETIDSVLKLSLYDYMKEHQRQAWWGYVMSAPFDLLGWGVSLFKKEVDDNNLSDNVDPFRLTRKQESFINKMRKRVVVAVDKKSGVIKASVLMQDALVSARVMDVVLTKLQAYIADYRTRKAKHDLAFGEKLFGEAKDAYYKTQQTYARYVDENRNVISASYRTEEERLRNEMSLAYGVYNQMAQQLEMNKIKVQEVTPVFTVIEPARVAIKAAAPNKPMVLIGFVMLTFILSIGIIVGKDFYSSFKN